MPILLWKTHIFNILLLEVYILMKYKNFFLLWCSSGTEV